MTAAPTGPEPRTDAAVEFATGGLLPPDFKPFLPDCCDYVIPTKRPVVTRDQDDA